MICGSCVTLWPTSEATAKELEERGVEFVQRAEKADWGTSAIFKDSEGNQFVLSTP